MSSSLGNKSFILSLSLAPCSVHTIKASASCVYVRPFSQLHHSGCRSSIASATNRAAQTREETLVCAALQVRAAAHSALACWSFELLELLELARPLDEYSRLLLEETDSMALAACEALVIRALAYEHARRRR